MIQWIDVTQAADFTSGTRRVLTVDGISILVFNLSGQYYALKNECSHAAYPLEEGTILGDEIVCPLHGATFCIKTGQARRAPAFSDIEHYPTRIEAGMVQVGVLTD